MLGVEKRVRKSLPFTGDLTKILYYIYVCVRAEYYSERRGSVEEWWAHNPQVAGSKPVVANFFASFSLLGPIQKL